MELFIEVEKDFTVYGDECKFGGGKVGIVEYQYYAKQHMSVWIL